MEKKFQAFGTRGGFTSISNRLFLLVAAVFFCFFTGCQPGNATDTSDQIAPALEPVRQAAVAGTFYPADKSQLAEYVDSLLDQASPPDIPGHVRALVVPHAGYIYSAPVAANAYKTIRGRDIRTVILMSNSHRHRFDGIALYRQGSFETPLGRVEIDSAKTAQLLAANPQLLDQSNIHADDHALEVQLPFLQRALKNFKIVPILFGTDDPALSQTLAEAIQKIRDEKTLIIASTDMSHYPAYDAAVTADRKTIEAILTGNSDALNAQIRELEKSRIPNAVTFLCGISAVRTAMMLAKSDGATNIRLLKYANSGDVSSDLKRVVGYSSMVFIKPAGPDAPSPVTDPAANDTELGPTAQAELLKLARHTVENYVSTREIPAYTPGLNELERPAGVFVTLKKNGQLRGCIGRFEPNIPLYVAVQQMAVSAATQDPRFPGVQTGELDKIEYEISVLSPLHPISSADEIVPGKHGVEVKKGLNRGVFLPQVAIETGWSKEQFLSELCSQKAGLKRDCWKDPSVKLSIFTAQVFSEKNKEEGERERDL